MSARGDLALTASAEGLRLRSPYDQAFVAAFKLAIPHTARRWDGQAKCWLVDPAYGTKLVDLVATFYGVRLELPTAPAAVATTEVVQLAYLGGCKTREDGSSTASGYTLGNRNAKAPDLVFGETVLRGWFDGVGLEAATGAQPAAAGTLYAVLCVAPDVDTAGLKAAYRRMARQTHPDVNREPDAAAQFRAVQDAYDVLSDTRTRRKYDAGLVLEQRARDEQGSGRSQASLATRSGSYSFAGDWRAPLRCGLLLVTGTRRLGRLEVAKILSWQDLSRDGRVLVSSWPQDAECWREDWVTP